MADQDDIVMSNQGLDFEAGYTGRPGQMVEGFRLTGVPWDIGAAQPTVQGMTFTGRVLDVGCGLGDNAAWIAGQGHDVTAVDASTAAIETARRRHPDAGVRFEVADARELTGYEDRFDTVLDSALFHAVPTPDRARYARALHRATRPGATLHVLCFADHRLDGVPAPLPVTETELRTALDEGGWEIEVLQRARYQVAGPPFADFLDRIGHPVTDVVQMPMWQARAVRRDEVV